MGMMVLIAFEHGEGNCKLHGFDGAGVTELITAAALCRLVGSQLSPTQRTEAPNADVTVETSDHKIEVSKDDGAMMIQWDEEQIPTVSMIGRGLTWGQCWTAAKVADTLAENRIYAGLHEEAEHDRRRMAAREAIARPGRRSN